MQYDDFINRVSQKIGLPREHAEVATQSVLSILAERLSQKEARDLASQLARELKPMLENVPRHGQGYLAREFVQLVADRERVPAADARVHAKAVLSTLRQAVSSGELGDVLSELWRDPEYEELWGEPAGAPPVPALDELSIGHEKLLTSVQQRTGLDRTSSELAMRATLTTLAERITRGESEDVAAQLPPELRPWLQRTSQDAESFSAREFIRRVAQRMGGTGRQEAERAARAVLVTLREVVSEAEMHDMFSQLPAEILRLFSPRAA